MPTRNFHDICIAVEMAINNADYAQIALLLLEIFDEHHGDPEAVRKAFEIIDKYHEEIAQQALTHTDSLLNLTASITEHGYVITRSRLCISSGKYQEASTVLQPLRTSHPSDQTVLDLLIDLYIERTPDHNRALEYILADLELENAKAAANREYLARRHNDAGTIYQAREDFENAVIRFQLATENDQKMYDYWYNLGLAQNEMDEYSQAEVAFRESLIHTRLPAEQGESYYMLGEVSEMQFKLHSAVDYYLKALSYLPQDVYSVHSLAACYRKLGNFKLSHHYLEKAIGRYREGYESGAFNSEPGKNYYYAQLIKEFVAPKEKSDYDRWKEVLNRYRSKNPDDVDGDIELFFQAVAKVRAIDEGELFSGRIPGEVQLEREEAQADMVNGYNMILDKLKDKIAATVQQPRKQQYFRLRLGQVHLAIEYFDEAIMVFDEALQIEPSNYRIIEARGVACYRSKKMLEAVKCFEKALKQNESSLNLSCNLGDSLRATGEIGEAETVYGKVSRRCPEYIDALIGMGECYKNRADKELEAGDREQAEERFAKARRFFIDAFDQQVRQYPSRKLTTREKNALYYSLGYTITKIYEAGNSTNPWLLRRARNEFNKISPNADEYLKARKAIHVIKERVSIRATLGKNATPLVCFLGLLIFAVTQFVAIKSYLRNSTTTFVLNKDAIQKLARDMGPDSSLFTKAFTPALIRTFDDREDLSIWINKEVDEKFKEKLQFDLIKEVSAHPEFTLDLATYGSFTFGSLMFIVIGLCLPLISKLKVGSIEMEKNTVDTVRPTAPVIERSS